MELYNQIFLTPPPPQGDTGGGSDSAGGATPELVIRASVPYTEGIGRYVSGTGARFPSLHHPGSHNHGGEEGHRT